MTLNAAREIDSNNVYLLQQLVLATYKGGLPSKVDALNNARELLGALEPDKSTDTETLGMAGAIYKRLWEETAELDQLSVDQAAVIPPWKPRFSKSFSQHLTPGSRKPIFLFAAARFVGDGHFY